MSFFIIFTIVLTLMQLSSYPIVISFDEIGFDTVLHEKGSVYKEATISVGYSDSIVVEWEIIYEIRGEGDLLLILGVNETNKTVSLNKGNKVFVDFTLQGEIRVIKLWFNLTSNGPEIILSPNSEIKLIRTKASNYDTFLVGVYFTLYTLPLAVLAVKRFGGEKESDVGVVKDEE